MLRKGLSKKARNNLRSRAKNKVKVFLLKVTVKILVIAAVCGLIYTLKSAIRQVFFSGNPKFTLEDVHVELVKGNFTEDQIKKKLPVKVGQANIYNVNLGDLRDHILTDPLVQEVEVRRILPGTIDLTIYGRTPIARLITREGRLIDAGAIVLESTSESVTPDLPIITGIPNLARYQTGEVLDNPMVEDAIKFLELKEVIPNGHWLNVHLIQLNKNYHEMRVYLNQAEELFIKQGALLILPTDGTNHALAKALEILDQRRLAKQPTSYIDVTYDKRVPVLP